MDVGQLLELHRCATLLGTCIDSALCHPLVYLRERCIRDRVVLGDGAGTKVDAIGGVVGVVAEAIGKVRAVPADVYVGVLETVKECTISDGTCSHRALLGWAQ